jgi:integrase
MLEKHVRNAALIGGLDYGRSKPRTAVSKSTEKARLRNVEYNPKRADGLHGFTLHSFRHTFVTDMLKALNGDAKTVMELSGHTNYESFQVYLHADEATLEKARSVIKRRDGNLAGNELFGVTGVKQSAAPARRKRRQPAPAAKAVLEKRRD